MGLVDLLGWLTDRITDSGPDEQVVERAATLSEAAADDTVTSDVLVHSGEQTAQPLVTYLEDDEQPEFVLRGGELLMSDADGSYTREYPSLETKVMVTDAKVLFVVGGRVSDKVWEAPLSDVVVVYVDEEDTRRYFVVEADRDDDEMTFFVDVTLEPNVASVEDCIAFIESHTG